MSEGKSTTEGTQVVGPILGIGVGFAVSTLGVFVSYAFAEGHGAAEILLFRMFFSALLLLPLVYKSIPRLFTKQSKFLWMRSCFGGSSALCYFYSLTHSSIAIATLLANFAPVWVLLLSWMFFNERLTRMQGIGAAIATGSIMVLNASSVAGVSTVVGIIGLAGSLFMALALVSLRQASQRDDVMLIVFIMSAVTALIGFIFSKNAWGTLSSVQSWPLWGVVITSLVYQTMLTMQYKKLSASLATILNLSGIAWSMMYDITLFSKFPSITEIVVAILVFCGLMIMQDWPRRLYARRPAILKRR